MQSEQSATPAPGRISDHARPRADWARVAPLAPVVSAPPITFDGERFGRSVPGARPLTTSHRVHTGRVAPSGVMLDVAKVEDVVPPVSDVDGALVDTAGEAGVLPPTPGIVHRKASPGRAGVQRLVTSDFEGEFPTAELRQAPMPPTTWTPDTGFVESDVPEEGAPRMRVVRRRPTVERASATDEAERDQLDEGDEADIGEPEQRVPVVRFVPVEGQRRVSPPPDLVDVIEQVTGVHVGDALIDRSPAVTERADEIGAVAFTERGVVHLPSELGPMDDPAVRSVAAHELVHVAQHRLRQGDIPSEDSPEGRELEAQARAVQRSIAPGTPVVPTFIRSDASRPVPRDVGPVGVQRLVSRVTEYEGPDLSDNDYSDVDPGSPNYDFAWQDRQDEPSGVPWPERQSWAQDFEDRHGAELQRRRDEAFRDRVAAAGGNVSEQQLAGLRRELDASKPYQFGPPAGIAPYPDVDLPDTPGGGGTSASSGGGGRSRSLPVVQPTPLERAESEASERELKDLATASRGRVAAHPAGDVDTFEQAMGRLTRRLDLERVMRIDLLESKRDAAQEQGAPDTHIVALTQDELGAIQRLVDAELPVDGGADYLPVDDHASITMARAFGGFVEVAATGALTRHALTRGRGRTADGGSSTGGSTARGSAGGGTPAPTGETDEESEADLILGQLRSVRANRVPDNAEDVTAEQLMTMMRARLERETSLRQDLLRAKRNDLGDDVARLPADFRVSLTVAEMTAICDALDRTWPQIANNGVYLAADQFGSLGLGGDDDWGPAIADPETVEDAIARRDRDEGRTPEQSPTAETNVPAATAPAPAAAPAAVAATATGSAASTNGVAMATTAAAPVATGAAADGAAPDTAAASPLGATAEAAATNVVEALSDIDLDRLTRRLWTRMRRELRSELLIDRERAGVLADMR